MTQQRLSEIKERMKKPAPEPYGSIILELIEAVEEKARASVKAYTPKKQDVETPE
jgi:hypothetical protein